MTLFIVFSLLMMPHPHFFAWKPPTHSHGISLHGDISPRSSLPRSFPDHSGQNSCIFPVLFLGLISTIHISLFLSIWGLDCEVLERWKLHLMDIFILNIFYTGLLISICSMIKIPMIIITVTYTGYFLCARHWTECFLRIFSLNSPSKSKRCVLHLFSLDSWETEA